MNDLEVNKKIDSLRRCMFIIGIVAVLAILLSIAAGVFIYKTGYVTGWNDCYNWLENNRKCLDIGISERVIMMH